MPTIHKVIQGEDMFTIAEARGFRDHRTIYDDSENAALRRERPNPGILFPGDEVVIPDREPRVEERPTDARHTFHTIGTRRLLRLRLLALLGKPIANQPYILEIDGRVLSQARETDDNGELTEAIPLRARTGKITAGDFSWELDIGELNPMESAPDEGISGAQARFFNLGYDPGPIDGEMGPLTASALRRFQNDQGMRVTGHLDGATRAALARAHGC